MLHFIIIIIIIWLIIGIEFIFNHNLLFIFLL